MSVIKKAWKIFDGRQRLRLCELLILILIGTALETVGVTAIVPFISAIMYPHKIMTNKYAAAVCEVFSITDTTVFIVFLAIALILAYFIKNLFLCFLYYAQYRFVYNNQRRLSTRLMRCYMSQPYAFHLKHNTAELYQSIDPDVDSYYHTILAVLNLITDSLVSIALITVMFIADKTITIVVSAAMGLFVLCFYKAYKNKILKLGEQRRINAMLANRYIHEAFGAIKEIKVRGNEDQFSDIQEYTFGKYVEARRKTATYTMFPKPAMETMAVTSLLIIIILKLSMGVSAEYFIPTLSVFALAVIRLLPSGSRISSNINEIAFGKASIDKIYSDITELETLEKNVAKRKQPEALRFNNEISVSSLSFSYEGSEKKVLDKLDMTIKKNRSTAFIGPSGAGKTTLADIILGVLEYDEGSVKIDGKELKDYREQWQCNVGYIPQSIYIFDDTIEHNIVMSFSDEGINEERLWKAIDKAQLRPFIESLPDGVKTVIGENGSRVSGGQKQRIGIARALYNDPEVLILDEATSALDNDTEEAVMEAIDALNGYKTLIIIAHRLSTIRSCDTVYKIEDGKAIEQCAE